MDEVQNKNGGEGDEDGHGRGDGAEADFDGGHIVFVTETPKVNEAKPSKAKSIDWHSGGGIVRIGESTTIRTIVKTTSVSESIRTYSDTPQTTTTTMKTHSMNTEGVTTWFTDMPTATHSVGSTTLPSTTATNSTTTGSSTPDGEDKPVEQLAPILAGSIGGLVVFMFLVGGLTGLYKLKRTKNQAVVDFDATAGTGSHSAPQHAHESYHIGYRPQPAMAVGAGSPQAGPSQAGASSVGDGDQYPQDPDQPMIAELPADTSYCRKLRDSHNEPV